MSVLGDESLECALLRRLVGIKVELGQPDLSEKKSKEVKSVTALEAMSRMIVGVNPLSTDYASSSDDSQTRGGDRRTVL